MIRDDTGENGVAHNFNMSSFGFSVFHWMLHRHKHNMAWNFAAAIDVPKTPVY
jgi:hypothetical protein